jgi:hypothetical protein
MKEPQFPSLQIYLGQYCCQTENFSKFASGNHALFFFLFYALKSRKTMLIAKQ